MGVPKRLTEKQIKFANLIVTEEGRKTDSDVLLLQVMNPIQHMYQQVNYKTHPYILCCSIHWKTQSREIKKI